VPLTETAALPVREPMWAVIQQLPLTVMATRKAAGRCFAFFAG